MILLLPLRMSNIEQSRWAFCSMILDSAKSGGGDRTLR
jgi:hypothetical protein